MSPGTSFPAAWCARRRLSKSGTLFVMRTRPSVSAWKISRSDRAQDGIPSDRAAVDAVRSEIDGNREREHPDASAAFPGNLTEERTVDSPTLP